MPERPLETAHMNDRPAPAVVTAIDLALSGGGFRATLFHLGVIGFLRERSLLKRVRTICSVSGGSVLAAHLVCHWDEYTSADDNVFRKRAQQLVATIMTRDVSGEVLKQSKERLFGFRALDSEKLVAEYQTLLHPEASDIHRWDDMDGKPELPQLNILATHLNTGQAGAYSISGFRILPVEEEQRHAKEIKALATFAEGAKISNQDIARAVAASSAFPPAFSPLSLVPGNPGHMLTDGGVYDNSGVNYLRHLYKKNGWTTAQDRMVIVSDAGREFPTELGNQYDTFMALALRVTDTQGGRIAESDSRAAEAFFKEHRIPILKLSIHDVVEYFSERPANHSVRVQELLAMIRTELDTFSAEEVFVLYRHGYLVAQKAYAARPGSDATLTGVPWTPIDSVTRDAADDPETKGLGNEDLATLGKDDLESRLKNGHVIRKQSELANSLRFRVWIMEWMLHRYWKPGLVVAAIMMALVILAYLVGSGSLLAAPAAPHGALPVVSAESYKDPGWAAAIPLLFPVRRSATPQHVYTVETERIGTLTGERPHSMAVATYQLTGPLADAELYLLLAQEAAPGEFRYIVLEEASTGRLKVPAGIASDRLRGMLISGTEIAGLQTNVHQYLTIALERP